MYACLAVTCHLHFWQNDRDFLRATVVTRGWNGYRNKSQHRKLTLEKKIILPFQQGFEPATFQSQVRRSNHWAIPAPWVTQMWHMRFYSPASSVPLHGQSGSPKICHSTFGLISFLTLSQSWHRQVLGSQTGTWDFSSFFVPVHRQSGSYKICHIMFDLDHISVLCTTRILSTTLLPMPSKLCGRWREIMSIWPVDRKQ